MPRNLLLDCSRMHLTPAERLRLRELVLGQHRDWAALHVALKERKLSISQSSLDRYFSGRSKSPRTLRTLARLLGTTPEALVNQVRMLSRTGRSASPKNFTSLRPLRDPDAFRVAFQLWIELTTRKLGLPIDPAQDVITECYDSWYSFFRSGRELIKTIPLHKSPKSRELRQLIQISLAVLNDGLRPHLQRWQAKFRRWFEGAMAAQSQAASPQEIQQLFPEWAALRDDLLATNQRLIGYVGALETMVGEPRASRRAKMRGKQSPKKSTSVT